MSRGHVVKFPESRQPLFFLWSPHSIANSTRLRIDCAMAVLNDYSQNPSRAGAMNERRFCNNHPFETLANPRAFIDLPATQT
jgi:hypothetical protein